MDIKTVSDYVGLIQLANLLDVVTKDIRIAYSKSGVLYAIGTATAGTLTSAASWKVFVFTHTGSPNNPASVLVQNNQVWDTYAVNN